MSKLSFTYKQILGSYLDSANSTSKYSDLVPGRKCLPGHSLHDTHANTPTYRHTGTHKYLATHTHVQHISRYSLYKPVAYNIRGHSHITYARRGVYLMFAILRTGAYAGGGGLEKMYVQSYADKKIKCLIMQSTLRIYNSVLLP